VNGLLNAGSPFPVESAITDPMPQLRASRSSHQENLSASAIFGHRLSLSRVAEWEFPTQTYFLSRTFKAVQGIFGMTCPLPSANLIFAVCMSAFKGPKCGRETWPLMVLTAPGRWSPLWPVLPATAVPTHPAGAPRLPLPSDKRWLFLGVHWFLARCAARTSRASPVR
jgi:hypothetical protein